MYFLLFLTFEGVKSNAYGPYVDDIDNDKRVICFRLEASDVCLFMEDVDEIDNKCKALLDYGDVDYFDTQKCAILKDWIAERLQKQIVPRYREMLEALSNYCQRAVELNTGVVIEL